MKAPLYKAIENLSRLAQLFLERREELAQEAGLTVAQWEVLEEIGGQRFLPSLFARRRRSTAAAVSKVLRQLLDKRLVAVSISPEDARQRRYVLTAQGRAIRARLDANRRRAIAAIWAGLLPRDVARFADFTGGLIERMERYRDRWSQRSRRHNGKNPV